MEPFPDGEIKERTFRNGTPPTRIVMIVPDNGLSLKQ